MKSKIPNWEIAVYALHILGGLSRRVHTEDTALKCFELAPDYFSWVKYPEYPDKDVARNALVDARKKKNGSLVQGRAGRGTGHSHRTQAIRELDGWLLTEAGVKWILQNEARLSTAFQDRETSPHRQDILQKLDRIRKHKLFHQFLDNPNGFCPALGDLAELFKCRVDSDRRTWQKRFQTTANLAQIAKDEQITNFIKSCKASVDSQI